MKKIEEFLLKLILGEKTDHFYNYFVKKSTVILSVFFLLSGFTLIFFGNQITSFLDNIKPLSGLQIVGIIFVLISLIFFLSYFLSQANKSQPGMLFILRTAFYCTILTFLFLSFILFGMPLKGIFLKFFSFLMIVEISILIISLFSILVILFNTAYRVLKEPSEKIILVLGIFATIITFIVTVLKELL